MASASDDRACCCPCLLLPVNEGPLRHRKRKGSEAAARPPGCHATPCPSALPLPAGEGPSEGGATTMRPSVCEPRRQRGVCDTSVLLSLPRPLRPRFLTLLLYLPPLSSPSLPPPTPPTHPRRRQSYPPLSPSLCQLQPAQILDIYTSDHRTRK